MANWNLARRDRWHQEYHLHDNNTFLKAGIYRRAGIPVHSIEMYNRGELVAKIVLDTVGAGNLKIDGAPAEHKDEIRNYLNCNGLTPIARSYLQELLGRIR